MVRGRFDHLDRMPYKAGVDEHDYRPTRKGGSAKFPSKFQKGKMTHHGYNTDNTGRILPKWHNVKDPRYCNFFSLLRSGLFELKCANDKGCHGCIKADIYMFQK